jgi:chemotaxis protein methyltransferase CheR
VSVAYSRREFAFEPEDHTAIARLAYEEAGIVLQPTKAQLVYGRLARRIRACGLTGFADYIALIQEDSEERTHAIDALTTNHTSFFRENHHFEHFIESCWPPLKKRLATGGRVRLWSAACSSGEEPYSLLMALLGTDRQSAGALAKQDFRLLGTDLSTDILGSARAARYHADTVKTIPPALREVWVGKGEAGGAQLHPLLRQLATFRYLNLLGDWPMRNKFDAIFCRNVMIYFDDETKARLQSRLADHLAVGGFLYIGHSERLAPDVAGRFSWIGRTTFQKVS